MLAEIIAIGDEILIGQIVDTNSAWIAKELNGIGVSVKQVSSVSDEKTHILNALKEAASRADIILITGGLGPTKDDITKSTLCEYFNTKLVLNQEILNDVKKIFNSYGAKLLDVNIKQAEVPENCEAIKNHNGTAPGMWFNQETKIYISMPGVPFEMKAMMSDYVLPKIKKLFNLPAIEHKTILTQGIGESFLAERIASWEDSLSSVSLKLAYLPSAGMVRLRLSGMGANKNEIKLRIEKKVEELIKLIPDYIFGFEEEKLEKIIGEELIKLKLSLATAESCTGGYIAHKITSISGSSKYYKGSIIAYSNEAKENLLGVKRLSLKRFGAVSEAVALEMAKGAKERLKADYALSCTGIAGPEGGTGEKPVGTVWIGIATPDEVRAKKFHFGANRKGIIQLTAETALNMLRKAILLA